MKNCYYLFILFFFLACQESDKSRISRLVKEWEGKEVIFPADVRYTVYDKDTVGYSAPDSKYKVVSYIDSVGCTSCKLQLYRWKEFMLEADSLASGAATFQFVFHPKERERKELLYLLKRDKFDYPVWIDNTDSFNKQNKFPEDDIFHTFLLNAENRIIAIGNPVSNPKIKELYLKIITDGMGRNSLSDASKTEVRVMQNVVDMGEFPWEEEQQVLFQLENIGSNVLVINDVVTSCGCTTVKYPKGVVKPGEIAEVVVTYRADRAEFFNKPLRVYGNVSDSPLVLRVKGNAK